MLPQTFAVRNCEESDSNFPAVSIHFALHVYAHCTCTFIQDGELGSVVERASHLGKEQTS